MNFKYVKFWAKVYQWTGYYYPRIDSLILRHVMNRGESLQKKLEIYSDGELNLKQLISIEIGMWQSIHGFHRPWRRRSKLGQFFRNIKLRLNRFLGNTPLKESDDN